MKIRNSEIAVIMCTYNGERYLHRQLRSLLEQTNKNWSLHVSDDGSKDETLEIILKFKKRLTCERVFIYNGPQKGFSRNFLSLLANSQIRAEYYALCDQDDIWNPSKLEAARQFLKNCDPATPALYCGRTLFVDENNKQIAFSNTPLRPPSFHNALVQNVASGNTMVINNAARELLLICGPDLDVYAHDWLIYLLVTGCGGRVYYDPQPRVRYRQHSENLIGMNTRLIDKIARLRQSLSGAFSHRNNQNLEALERLRPHLTQDNIKIIDDFKFVRSCAGPQACHALWRSGVYRDRRGQNLALYLGAFLGKL